MPELTPKQKVFVQEYLRDLNATAAYRRAGYAATGNSAETAAARLLRNVQVAAAIEAALSRRAARCEIRADNVLKELARIGFSDMRDFVGWGPDGVQLKVSSELTPEAAVCVAEVSQTRSANGGSIRFKLHDKVAALEKLGKHLGLFVDRHEISGTLHLEHEPDLSRLTDEQLAQLEALLTAAHGGGAEGTLPT